MLEEIKSEARYNDSQKLFTFVVISKAFAIKLKFIMTVQRLASLVTLMNIRFQLQQLVS
jgi:hypothetical protein